MSSTMRAVEIQAYGKRFATVHRSIPELQNHEVLLRVIASGLCSTDLHLLEGRMDLGVLPRIPGHETAGIVERIGSSVDPNILGKRVTVALDVLCGSCRHCLTGQPQRCTGKQRLGFELDGGHADFVAVPAANIVVIPDTLSFEQASILPDAVACMYHALIKQGQMKIHDHVVIHGVGGLGIHGVQLAVKAGAEVYATSRKQKRLKLAEDHGAVPIDTSSEQAADAVLSYTHQEGADIVADCIGTQRSILESIQMVRPGGKVLVVGYIDQNFSIPSMEFMIQEKELIGCRGSSKQDLIDVVHLAGSGAVKPIIGNTFDLFDINDAADMLSKGDVEGRIVLTRKMQS